MWSTAKDAMDDVAPPVAVGEEPPVGAGGSAAAVHCGGPQQYVCLHFGSVFTDSSSLSNAAATLLLSLKLLSSLIIGPLVFCLSLDLRMAGRLHWAHGQDQWAQPYWAWALCWEKPGLYKLDPPCNVVYIRRQKLCSFTSTFGY